MAPNREKASSLKGVVSKYYQMMMTEEGHRDRDIFSHPMSFSFVKKIIDSTIGMDQFKFLSEKPLYMASLGQVHKGILKTGDIVAVKIQYPSLKRDSQKDMESLRFIFRLLEKKGFPIDHTHILHDIESTTLNELNYKKEHYWLRYMRHMLPSRVVIPTCFDHVCFDQVLMTHWIPHDPFFASHRISKSVAIDLFISFYRPLYQQGLLNGDANITNIGISNNQLVLCDFGCMIPLPSMIVKGLHHLYDGILNHDWTCQLQGLEELGFVDDHPGIIEFIKLFMGPILNDSPSQFSNLSYDVLVKILNTIPFTIYPKHMIYLQRMTVCLYYILSRIHHPMNWYQIFKRHILKR